MTGNAISADLKRRCVEASETMTKAEIYKTIFSPEHPSMSYEVFRHKIKLWKKRIQPDEETLHAGTYPGFLATHATVQVNENGEIVQAWVKQDLNDDERYQKLIDTVRETAQTISQSEKDRIVLEHPADRKVNAGMLEINLADMHFGLPNDYDGVRKQLLGILYSKVYEEINIVLGQDLFHNDDFRGRTSKGTPIEKVDIQTAWNDSLRFWMSIIRASVDRSERVRITYIKGNHDESLSWAFVQLIKGLFPDLYVDDSLEKRKCISWRGCFIGLTHGEERGGAPLDLRGMFTIEFPVQFAGAKVREIHASHLHHEEAKDLYGVMTRRLSTANTTDDWSRNGGFVGAHKRFMCFEYAPNRLTAIYYLEGEE